MSSELKHRRGTAAAHANFTGAQGEITIKTDTNEIVVHDGTTPGGWTGGGYKPAGTGAVARTVQDKLREFVSVRDFGAVGDGVADDTAAIQAAIQAARLAGGGQVWFPKGIYKTTSPIHWMAGVTLRGPGLDGQDRNTYQAEIRNANSDMFVTDYTQYTVGGQGIYGLKLVSQTGGGHIFVSKALSRTEYAQLCLIQLNPDKAILYSDGTWANDEGYFGCWWHHFDAMYMTGNTMPAFYIKNGTINQVVIENARIGRNAIASGGTYAIWIEAGHNTVPAIAVKISQITFQQPGGGAIRLLGATYAEISGVGIYDQTQPISNPLVYIGQAPSGAQAQSNTILNSSLNVGDTTNPSVYTETAIPGNGGTTIINSKINVLDGGSVDGNGSKVLLINSIVNTIRRIATVNFGTRSISCGSESTAGQITSFDIKKGSIGSNDGYVQFLVNGTNAAQLTSAGEFRVGSAPASPGVQLRGASGTLLTANQVYPGTPAGARQTSCGLLAGTGVPDNSNGNNNDIYFRGDGTTGSTIYHKRAGVWVAIL